MKVTEKGTDRTAFAHITVEGRVNPLEEYGQYVDARDKALCCYVAVEEGYKLRIKGSFSGLTLLVAYDCTVDGVCRKANSFAGKSVQAQRSKKLDVDSFLYETTDGVIDTKMSVIPYTGPTSLNKTAPETVGTIELRVYITRQFGVEHELNDDCKYYNDSEDMDSSVPVASYQDVPPQYEMAFEKDAVALDARKANQEWKKVQAKRPGTEPWAIFRFHYRTKESIEANKMNMSFDSSNKSSAKQEAHPLELDAVPPLIIGSKPAAKHDGESVRTSSPPPPDTPSTPVKSGKKSQTGQPKVVLNKQQPKSQTLKKESTSKMAPTTDTESVICVESPIIPKDILAHIQSTPAKTDDGGVVGKAADDKKGGDPANIPEKCDNGISDASTPKKAAEKVAKKATENTDAELDKPSMDVVKKSFKKAEEKEEAEMANAAPTNPVVETPNEPMVPHPADVPSIFDNSTSSNVTASQAILISNTKDFIKSGSKGFTSPLKKAATKPAHIDTTTSTLLEKPVVAPIPASPLKRAPEGTLTPPPDVKRMKAEAVPQLAPTRLPRTSTASPGPRSPSIEAQVAEQRKRLEDARKKRAEMAKQKAALEKKLAPYKQRMAEELERLKQEMADEEAAMAADQEEFMTSEAMLAEFECGDGGI